MAENCFHPSIEGAQHGAKTLAQFLDYAKKSGAAGAYERLSGSSMSAAVVSGVAALVLDANRTTPAVRLDDGRDYVPTNRWVVFGHHFAAIAGPGPLVGPTLAAQFGYLPGVIWIIVGIRELWGRLEPQHELRQF